MKYYKLEYDMNRPSVKQVAVPTDSEYGVAVKVYRNGELVDGDISVGGLSATEGSGDWQLVKLESGSTATTGELDVELNKPNTLEGDYTGEISTVNGMNRPMQISFKLPISAFCDSDLTIAPEDINLELLQIRVADQDAEYGDFTDWSNQYGTINSILTFTKTGIASNLFCNLRVPKYTGEKPNSWKYYKSGVGNVVKFGKLTLPLASSIYFGSQYVQAYQKGDVKYRLTINTHDGVNGNFKLIVQQSDKGYIEVEKESVESEPEETVE